MRHLEFNLLPSTKYGHSFYRLGELYSEKFKAHQEIIDRAHGCTMFALKIGQECDLKSREAYVRAALAELASIEDMVDSIAAKGSYKLNSSHNPLLHLLRELRNLSIHIKSSTVIFHKTRVLYGNSNDPSSFDGAMEFEHDIWYVVDLTKDEFMRLNNSKQYGEEDIERMLRWFNSAQKDWGISDLIYKGLHIYLDELIEYYSL